ncbi:unnamed protein product [Auanema sp. JU1783]|nr:unnamed protein product [Auanema sp. JU1783]
MDFCGSFEDFEYHIFGNDRCWIVMTDIIIVLTSWFSVYKMPSLGIRTHFISLLSIISILLLIRVFKIAITLLDPEDVESYAIFCWALMTEYTLHYSLSNLFSFTELLLLLLICKQRTTVFPDNPKYRKLYMILTALSLLIAFVMEICNEILEFFPTKLYIIIQIFVNVLTTIVFFMTPCFAIRRASQKDREGGFSVTWVYIYFLIPGTLQLYQSIFFLALLFPLFGIRGFEGNDHDIINYYRYVESHLAHKFSFTTLSILAPALFLIPLFRDAFHIKRRDRVIDSGDGNTSRY